MQLRVVNWILLLLFIATIILLSSCRKHPANIDRKPTPKVPPHWVKEVVWYQIEVDRFHNGDDTNDANVKNIDQIPDSEIKDMKRLHSGDLQGILDKLDYLKGFGVNGLYFNSLSPHPANQQDNTTQWRHVDVNVGPDPRSDLEVINQEDSTNPHTWVMTQADQMFIEVLKQAKARGMKVILASGIRLNDNKLDNDEIKNNIFAVSRRWLDPNNDGDPSDGVDGFHLSIQSQIPLNFLRNYRSFVKTLNPDAYLLGEIALNAEQTPTSQTATIQSLLKGDTFDGLVNKEWYYASQKFFANTPSHIKPSEFAKQLHEQTQNFDSNAMFAMMNITANKNLASTHTSQANLANAKLFLAFQYTFVGTPQIWAGDEKNILGNRASAHELFNYYQFMVKLRRANPVLQSGALVFDEINDKTNIFAYRRFNQLGQQALIIFNMGVKEQYFIVPNEIVDSSSWQVWRSDERLNILQTIPSEQIILNKKSVTIILTE